MFDLVKYGLLLKDKSCGSLSQPCHDTALDLQILMCLSVCGAFVLMLCFFSQFGPDDYRKHAYTCMPDEGDVDVSCPDTRHDAPLNEYVRGHDSVLFSYQTKLSRLCEQDKALRTQEEKLQQLYREKVSRQCTSFVVTDSHRAVGMDN